VPIEQSKAEQKRGQRTHVAKKQQKRLSLLNCPPHAPAHPATTNQSDAVLHNLQIETVSQGTCLLAVKGAGACLTRQEQVAPYSLVMTAATATTLRTAMLLLENKNEIGFSVGSGGWEAQACTPPARSIAQLFEGVVFNVCLC